MARYVAMSSECDPKNEWAIAAANRVNGNPVGTQAVCPYRSLKEVAEEVPDGFELYRLVPVKRRPRKKAK